MAIVTGDLKWYLTGAGADGGAQADPAASIGNYRSSTEITSNSDNNIFDDVSGAEAAAGDTEYRCLCVKNTHGSLSLQGAKLYLSDADIGAGNTLSFAVEVPTGDASTGNAQTIANEGAAPTVNAGNVSNWSTATDFAGGVAININGHSADLAPGNILFVWLKRVIGAAAAAAAAVNFTPKLEGDTAA